MNYKVNERGDELFFKYVPQKINKNNISKKKTNKENPFRVLKNLNFS